MTLKFSDALLSVACLASPEFVLAGSSPTLAEAARTSEREQAHQPNVEHEGAGHGHYKNSLGFLAANTYEAEQGVNIFTLGGEYGRHLTDRVTVVGEFEYAPGPGAWIFVVPVELKVLRNLEVFAGPGIEHLSRRRGHETESGEHGEGETESEGESEGEGADNLFLFRVGAGYHFPVGERFYFFPHFAYDFVNEDGEVARAFVYGVTLGFGF